MHAVRALAIQLVAAVTTLLMLNAGVLHGLSLLALAGLQGLLAAALAGLVRMDRWWLPIHLAFLPALVLARSLQLPAWLWAAGFLLLVLIYWSTFRTRVPLFLSNRKTVALLAQALPAGPLRVLDIGSGTGSFARPFASLRPESQVFGIEAAPGPAWLAGYLARGKPNLQLARGDFFEIDWSGFDVVYAFLSPVPMADVWEKAARELRPGAVLVSNSFPVPDVAPEGVLTVDDLRKTRLYCYTIRADRAPDTQKQHRVWPWRRKRGPRERG
ncbi:class I SAM-dependent methyltransferase [Niveibacterium sp. SC-1]|uniref:class I SAM-dependent methyltransferase n=1 Tax=Niveibacterium sp. SC-1 TaxID=3135646 RepID=UPI00311F9FFA